MEKLYGKQKLDTHLLENVYFHGSLETINGNDDVYASNKFDIKDGIHKVIAELKYIKYKANMFIWTDADNKQKGLVVSEDDGLASEHAYKLYNSKSRWI